MRQLLVFSAFCLATITPFIKAEPVTSVFREGVEPYCNEKCPPGFEYVESLGNCYRLLLELGPVSQDKGVIACGLVNGSTLPTFINKGDDDLLRDYFWSKYENEISSSAGYTPQAGFWTAYVRKAADGTKDEDNFVKEYVNLYSGNPINQNLWSNGQPNNDNLDQPCVARKRFFKKFLHKGESDDVLKQMNGLDDYQCAYPHFVICSLSRAYALNKRAYNTAIMSGNQEGGDCQLDWVTQSKHQFDMMIENAYINGNDDDAQAYEEARERITNSVPYFQDICIPDFNYKCE